MGSRINFVFDDGTEALTVLYSHWGQSTWQDDLAGAISHAKPRHRDYSYFTRMVISHLIKDYVLDETGFGIYAINRSEMSELLDWTVVIDLVNDEVRLEDGIAVPFFGEVLV